MKTVAVVQARMGSTRLANKMLLYLHGKPIIHWVLERVKKSNLIDDIVVAIPDTKENDILEKSIKRLDINVFRGSEENVLNRFYNAVKDSDVSTVVRVCADNPLIDAQEIDNLIQFYKNNPCDYAYNHIPKDNLYPDGLGAEIISFSLLKELNDIITKKEHKEHCLSYIVENSHKFVIKTFNPIDENLHYPELRFDIDSFEDYYRLSMKNFDVNISSQDLIKLFMEK